MYVLLCCWVAAVGAGLVKSEEILEGVARLRISNDIEFEEQTFMGLMSAAKEVGNMISLCFYHPFLVLCFLFFFLMYNQNHMCSGEQS